MKHASLSMIDIERNLTEEILSNFPVAKDIGLTSEQNMLESGAIDSMGLLTIIDIVEQTFKVTIEDDEVIEDNFASIRSLTAFIAQKLQVLNNTQINHS